MCWSRNAQNPSGMLLGWLIRPRKSIRLCKQMHDIRARPKLLRAYITWQPRTNLHWNEGVLVQQPHSMQLLGLHWQHQSVHERNSPSRGHILVCLQIQNRTPTLDSQRQCDATHLHLHQSTWITWGRFTYGWALHGHNNYHCVSWIRTHYDDRL